MRLFGPEGSPAKTCRSQEWPNGKDCEEKSLDCSTNLRDLLSSASHLRSLSKTCQGFSLPTPEETSKSLFPRWPSSGMASRGACLTAATSESPNHASESS